LRRAIRPRWKSVQLVIDHPQLDVFDRIEFVVLDGAERDAVLAADGVAVMAVDQDVAPQNQGFAAAFGEQAAFQGFMFGGREGVDVSTEFVVNRDVQFVSLHLLLLAVAFAVRMLHHALLPPKQVDCRRPDVEIKSRLLEGCTGAGADGVPTGAAD
jgi:hypothetical protein